MDEIRCKKCLALLFKIRDGKFSGIVEIKCRKCGYINKLDITKSNVIQNNATIIRII